MKADLLTEGCRSPVLRYMVVAWAMALFTGCSSSPPAGPGGPSDAREALVTSIVASTTEEWTEMFSREGRDYTPPDLTFLSGPPGSIRNASRYMAGLGMVVDLADVETLELASGAEAPSWTALLMAHEVGHHVQYLLGEFTDSSTPSWRRELQADCYAGLWLARANRRGGATSGSAPYPPPTLERFVRGALARMEAELNDGGAAPAEARTHGSHEERIAAFRRGLAGARRSDCPL